MIEYLYLVLSTYTKTWRLALICILASFLIKQLVDKILSIKKLPPGPWGVPFLGSLPWMFSGAPHSWYLSLCARYGDIFSVQLGSNLVVCVGSPKLLRQLFNKLDSIGRPKTPLNNLLGGFGIIVSDGLLWKRQRPFLHEKFRALGVKLWKDQRFEQFIIMEVKELLTEIACKEGRPVDPEVVLGRHVHNVICQLMMSFRFKEDDPDFHAFNERVSRGMKLFGSVHIGEHITSYLKLPGKMEILQQIKRNLEDISEFHDDHVRRRQDKRAIIEQYEPADLLDHYLHQIEMEQSGKVNATVFTDIDKVKQVVQVMNDLFSAGMETSRNTLLWILIIIMREPKVATKVRDELAKVVEVGKLVTLEHRPKLPYVEAVIFETLRRVSVVPLGTTHVNTEDWHVEGYKIPARTQIIPLINKINMDPQLFPQPEKIIPERFLKDGAVRLPDYFIPFGVGRRVCLGEQLARMELFLFFANLMNNYEFSMPDGHAIPELEGIYGTTHTPVPFKVQFKKLKM